MRVVFAHERNTMIELLNIVVFTGGHLRPEHTRYVDTKEHGNNRIMQYR
jgi:hypothetical protein